MNRYQGISNNFKEQFLAYKKEDRRIADKIVQRSNQIARLEKRRTKLAYPHWTAELLRPLWEEVKTHFLMVEFSDKKDEYMYPMGMNSRVTLFAKYGGETLMVAFVTGSLKKGELYYETGGITQENAYDCVTNPNGFGRKKELVTSVEQIVGFIKRQITEKVYPETVKP